MMEAYDDRQVVGMDLHRRRSVLVRMTGDGRKLETVRIGNSPPELRRVIAKAGERPKVVLEATYGWYWAADTLAGLAGAEVHLAHPLGSRRQLPPGQERGSDPKYGSDPRTTRRTPPTWRTCCGWAGWRRRGFAPPQVRELRELTRYGSSWCGCGRRPRTRCTRCWPSSASPSPARGLFGAFGSTWLDGLRLPQPYTGKVVSLRQLTAWLTGEISLLDEVIADFLGSYPPYQAVLQLPGLGPALAAVVVAEIGDISRFPSPGHLCAGPG